MAKIRGEGKLKTKLKTKTPEVKTAKYSFTTTVQKNKGIGGKS
jgi:hypothetical protein